MADYTRSEYFLKVLILTAYGWSTSVYFLLAQGLSHNPLHAINNGYDEVS